MNTRPHHRSIRRARFQTLHAITTAGLLLMGLGVGSSRADILYAANYTGNTVVKFTPGGVGSLFASTGLNAPEGLAFDIAGNLYAANQIGGTIEKFSPTGTDLGVFVDSSSGLSAPTGLAFDSAGNLFVANSNRSTIEEFSSSGTDLGTFADGTNNVVYFPTYLAFGPVPEPGTALFGIACIGVAAFRRRRRA